MLPEYSLDYRKARPNRFAPNVTEGSLLVVLEPDIAQVFTTPESVKKVLQALVEAMAKGTSGSQTGREARVSPPSRTKPVRQSTVGG